jgi:hypothetical protein
MSPPIASGKSESGTARFLGSGSSGILELLIFHPVDTVAKRLMSNQTKVKQQQSDCFCRDCFETKTLFSSLGGLTWEHFCSKQSCHECCCLQGKGKRESICVYVQVP